MTGTGVSDRGWSRGQRPVVDQRGSGTVLAVMAIAVVAATAVVAAVVAGLVVAREQVAAAADQTALSTARAQANGEDACAVAAEIAERNGTDLRDCEVVAELTSFVVTVTVTKDLDPHWPGLPDRVEATAHAGRP